MKKCKWCNSDIEDNVTVCPYCKANQNTSDQTKQTNHVEKFLKNDNTPKWKQEKKL